MKKILKSIKKFKYRSAFVHFYLNVLMVAVVISILFSAFIYKTYIRNFSDSHTAANTAILNQAVDETDNAIKQLYASLMSITKDRSTVKVIVAPSTEDVLSNTEIALRLDNTKTNFAYINQIFLYEDTLGTLFSSDEFVGKKDKSKYKRLIDSCLTSKAPYFDKSIRQSAKIIPANGKLYMVCSFIPMDQKYLGSLICEINRDMLFEAIQHATENYRYLISITTEDNVHLFSSANPENRKVHEELLLCSDLTGWKFTLFTTTPVIYTFEDYIKNILPFMLVVILIAIALSFAVTTFIYSPIDSLLSLIEEDVVPETTLITSDTLHFNEEITSASTADVTNEFHVLKKTYTKLSNDNKITESFIREVRPYLETTLLHEIITDPECMTRRDIDMQLELLNSSLTMQGHFQNFIMRLASLKTDEKLLHYAVGKQIFSDIAKQFEEKGCDLYIIFFNQETLSFLASYHVNSCEENCVQLKNQILELVRERFSEISEEIILASGSVQTNLSDISTSYLEAKESIKRFIYYGNESMQTVNQEETAQNESDLLSRLQDVVEKGNLQDLNVLCDSILNDIYVNASEASSFITSCSDMIDILIAKLYIVPGMDSRISSRYASIYSELEGMSSKQEAFNYMCQMLSDLIETLKNEYSRSQHKIVSAAKDYIRLHYSDSNLGIHQIADSIGITDAYLSSIFAEYTGENLVTYLNRLRVDMAKELLLNTKIIIKDVGYKTGFYTVQNFNRVFKRFTNMTPGEFRKNNNISHCKPPL